LHFSPYSFPNVVRDISKSTLKYTEGAGCNLPKEFIEGPIIVGWFMDPIVRWLVQWLVSRQIVIY
jgi:hypothetical protein